MAGKEKSLNRRWLNLKKMLFAAILSIFIILPYPAWAAIGITVDGTDLLMDTPPVNENGRVLVPLRAIFEKLDTEVTWAGDTQTIYALNEKTDTLIVLQINNGTAMVGGREYVLDVPPAIINGRTMVPVRFISENLGADVSWQNGSPANPDGKVIIQRQGNPEPVAGTVSVSNTDELYEIYHRALFNGQKQISLSFRDDLKNENPGTTKAFAALYDVQYDYPNLEFVKGISYSGRNSSFRIEFLFRNKDVMEEIKARPEKRIAINSIDQFETEIISSLKGLEEEMLVDFLPPLTYSDEAVTEAFDDVIAKYPELAYFSEYLHSRNSIKISYDSDASVSVHKNLIAEQLAGQIVSKTTTEEMSDREKALILHDYIVENTIYDTDVLNSYLDTETHEKSDSYTAFGVLSEHKGVCSGYARAYELLLEKAGIEAERIHGQIIYADTGKTFGHEWNLMKIDGTWYHTDVTWDDPVTSLGNLTLHSYFMLTEEEIRKDHFL